MKYCEVVWDLVLKGGWLVLVWWVILLFKVVVVRLVFMGLDLLGVVVKGV